MELNTCVTSLLRVPIRIYFEHYVLLVLLILSLIYLKSLKKNRLQILCLVALIGLIIDLIVKNSGLRYININQVIQAMLILFGLYLLPGLKKNNIAMILVLISIYLIADIMAYYYVAKGRYSLFIDNFYYPFSAPFFFIFFYRLLIIDGRYRRTYFWVAFVSSLFFICDYLLGSEYELNPITIEIYCLEHIIFSCLVIARLVIDEGRATKLSNEPTYWLCAGMIINSLVVMICDGLQTFLVEHYMEVYGSTVLLQLKPYSTLLLSFCYFYTFSLCGKQHHERFSYTLLKKSKIKI
jgi:hypothetical protein